MSLPRLMKRLPESEYPQERRFERKQQDNAMIDCVLASWLEKLKLPPVFWLLRPADVLTIDGTVMLVGRDALCS